MVCLHRLAVSSPEPHCGMRCVHILILLACGASIRTILSFEVQQ